MQITVPDFAIQDDVRIIALQGDWGVKFQQGGQGARLIIDDLPRARVVVDLFLERLFEARPHLALVPELAIPRDRVLAIVQTLQRYEGSIIFAGGVEGLSRPEYESLLTEFGQSLPLSDNPGDYVNAMLLVVRTPSYFGVWLRAKRIPSRPENDAPPMILGDAPFISLVLGDKNVVFVPLICSEFVWAEGLWQRLEDETPAVIDLLAVLQHNDDPTARHLNPQLHRAYSSGGRTASTRFLFINQARSNTCDGNCNVVVPPNSPGAPSFDQALNELWNLSPGATYKGFRIPDCTGCFWYAHVRLPRAATSALGNRVCEGKVTEVIGPSGARLTGLSIGLMRTAAHDYRQTLLGPGATGTTAIRELVATAVTNEHPNSILRPTTSAQANDVLFRMICNERPSWDAIERVVEALVQAAALLFAGGDEVSLVSNGDNNCTIARKPIAILYAPDVDAALNSRYSQSAMMEASILPCAVILVGVVSGAMSPDARKIGDVIRSDRVTSASSKLSGLPDRTVESAVTIRIDDIEFRPLLDLYQNLHCIDIPSARHRILTLFPKVSS